MNNEVATLGLSKMRFGSVVNALVAIAFLLVSCKSGEENATNENASETETFENPILPGFYPDPSVYRVGENYYLVNSSFAYFPGVPIFQSTDLVNWVQLGHVLDRPEQLDLEGLGISRGIFAPTIQYHEGTYYMLTTLIDNGGNFVVTATDPAGPWSNPHWLPTVRGIDPSLYFDESGKSFVIYNGDPPGRPLYDGHRAIRMIEFDLATLKTIGEDRVLVNGGVNIDEKPVWIEGPHIFKRGEFYYLCAAEGGTSVNHSQVIFRTRDLNDPFIPYENNPILTQRHMDPNRENPVSATGHAELVQTQNGEWWATFLATRPYDLDDSYNIGREVFLAPVTWTEDDWPIINADFEAVQFSYPLPDLPKSNQPMDFPKSGSFTLEDRFDSEELKPYWMFIRVPKEEWFSLSSDGIEMKLREETVGGTSNPSFIGRRQQHQVGYATTDLDFSPKAPAEKSGLLLFQNETHHLLFGKSLNGEGEVVLGLWQSDDNGELNLLQEEVLESDGKIQLKVVFDKALYKFEYRTAVSENWEGFYDFEEGTFLSTRVAGGFVGVVMGPYASSSGEPSSNTAQFSQFTYSGE
ncbi:glycoside hydrolase family 43 protein [Lunatibacter salilacus]|uniref:glycoside hydrolase family 43 protein n=1 Tax=Lunatibacter salilacus TaxID=2483804 RepID=UPI001F4031D4|nr:glycoside hydrolase family 43 protein [Lunatibacter salilacus]